MRYAFISSALIASVSAHGLVLRMEGANNVTMPGLSVTDGTPRDCTSNGCGSQADTSIIRDRDMSQGKASALGRTQGNGPVNAATAIGNFMGTNQNVASNAGQTGVGQEDDLSGLAGKQRRDAHKTYARGLLDGLLGGGAAGAGLGGLLGGAAGGGGQKGLPTADDQGMVTMVYRQINQDGAGPLSAAMDGTSGGTDPNAFKNAQVMQDVPGLGVGGLSLATNTDFPVKVQMPQGMTCDATVGGAQNVCIVRVRNSAAAGPFGGSAAFTQTPAARKRAIAFRLRKRAELAGEADPQTFEEAVKAENAEEGDLDKRFRLGQPADAQSIAAANKAEEDEDEAGLNKRFRLGQPADAASIAAANKAEEDEDEGGLNKRFRLGQPADAASIAAANKAEEEEDD
ncbi:putative cell surface protein [Hirsutella rhossiliensis]|uniref:Cell surface protein n=1 Tax=Hirsutella rhossiliensis TaxID=111463 RepID=A0A9P8SL20_9HYPO|nr:putative cell surface protein [Hirsutella rhossiliensis]KAH0966496.1 putative cell surface protein [Hirsutella rhossiliensis]